MGKEVKGKLPDWGGGGMGGVCAGDYNPPLPYTKRVLSSSLTTCYQITCKSFWGSGCTGLMPAARKRHPSGTEGITSSKRGRASLSCPGSPERPAGTLRRSIGWSETWTKPDSAWIGSQMEPGSNVNFQFTQQPTAQIKKKKKTLWSAGGVLGPLDFRCCFKQPLWVPITVTKEVYIPCGSK